MKKNSITVTIAGPTMSGKTFAAVIIENALKSFGFVVEPFTNYDGDVEAHRSALSKGCEPDLSVISVQIEEHLTERDG